MRTVEEIRAALQDATEEEYGVLAHALAADQRKGVRKALEVARRRLDAQALEDARLSEMYRFQEELAQGGLVVGLDEVGRGPMAGPLTVAAVILPETPHIAGLNDSKQLSHSAREHIAAEVKEHARAFAIEHIEPQVIDEVGMAKALRLAFSRALARIEEQGLHPDVVLLDGNPLRFDEREVNVVKGDAKCASIAAASIIAKVERDALMVSYDQQYPGYGFAANKGYGAPEHLAAISRLGLSPIHRKSFCTSYTQETLF